MQHNKYAYARAREGDTVKCATVTLTLAEVNKLVDIADKALDGDSNDDEHDALYLIRERLADMSTDPERRGEK